MSDRKPTGREDNTVSWDELVAAARAGEVVVDVREPVEFASGHLPGARSLPSTQVRQRLWELPRNRRLWLVCATGARSGEAAAWLNAIGYDAVSCRDGLRHFDPTEHA